MECQLWPLWLLMLILVHGTVQETDFSVVEGNTDTELDLNATRGYLETVSKLLEPLCDFVSGLHLYIPSGYGFWERVSELLQPVYKFVYEHDMFIPSRSALLLAVLMVVLSIYAVKLHKRLQNMIKRLEYEGQMAVYNNAKIQNLEWQCNTYIKRCDDLEKSQYDLSVNLNGKNSDIKILQNNLQTTRLKHKMTMEMIETGHEIEEDRIRKELQEELTKTKAFLKKSEVENESSKKKISDLESQIQSLKQYHQRELGIYEAHFGDRDWKYTLNKMDEIKKDKERAERKFSRLQEELKQCRLYMTDYLKEMDEMSRFHDHMMDKAEQRIHDSYLMARKAESEKREITKVYMDHFMANSKGNVDTIIKNALKVSDSIIDSLSSPAPTIHVNVPLAQEIPLCTPTISDSIMNNNSGPAPSVHGNVPLAQGIPLFTPTISNSVMNSQAPPTVHVNVPLPQAVNVHGQENIDAKACDGEIIQRMNNEGMIIGSLKDGSEFSGQVVDGGNGIYGLANENGQEMAAGLQIYNYESQDNEIFTIDCLV